MVAPAILFSAASSLGTELWFTDGTATGTRLVKDINAGLSSFPVSLTAIGAGRVVFVASTAAVGLELWVSDGTEPGTMLVRDIFPGNAGSNPRNFRAIGEGRVLFTANDSLGDSALWVSDGTAAGTQKLIDLYPGPYTTSLRLPGPHTSPNFTTSYLDPQGFAPLGDGRFVFAAGVSGANAKLFVTDGTAAGTVLIDVVPVMGEARLGNLDVFAELAPGRVLFRGNSADGVEPWVTDGTAAGTRLLRDIAPSSSSPSGFTALGNGLAVFQASGTETDPIYGSARLWATDGTPEGTVRIGTVTPGASFARLGDGRAVLAGGETVHGYELWVTDGTAGGTRLVRDIMTGPGWSSPTQLTSLADGRVAFRADDGVNGAELWVTDGSAEGTVMLTNLDPRPLIGSSPTSLFALADGRLLFNATVQPHDAELWITDGSAAGASLLKDIYPDSPTPYIYEGVLIQNGRGNPNGFTSLAVPAIRLLGDAAPNTLRGQDGDDVLGGGGGDDSVAGGWGDDRLSGDAGADRLQGGDGRDTLTGGAGNDLLDGEAGADLAIFADAFARYAFTQADGLLTVDGPDGRDGLWGIETLRFLDRDISLAEPFPMPFFAVTDTGIGRGVQVSASPYAGPVGHLRWQFLGTAGGEAVAGTAGTDFLNALGGDDAIDAGGGDDVLDGGTGSNFLTGAAGRDTFFLDGRGVAATWSTITDWEAGEQLSLFGWRPGVSRLGWLDQDGTAGYRGATLHADLDGNGLTETSVTWSGQARAALPTPYELDGLLWFT